MTVTAAQLLAELRQDHRNMAVLLDLLQKEIDHIDHEDDAIDFELLCDIMRYMTVYPDATHHPREDLIYAAMRSAQPELAKGLEAVVVDHKDIAEFSERLLEDIEAIIAGATVEKVRVVGDAQQYVHRLREHMMWEEKDLFPRADTMVDQLKIDESHLQASDPVFGVQPDTSFANLSMLAERRAN